MPSLAYTLEIILVVFKQAIRLSQKFFTRKYFSKQDATYTGDKDTFLFTHVHRTKGNRE